MSHLRIKIEREEGDVRRITLGGERKKIMMATYLINNLISTFSTAKPVHEKLNVKRRVDEAYQTDINNLSSGEMSQRHGLMAK